MDKCQHFAAMTHILLYRRAVYALKHYCPSHRKMKDKLQPGRETSAINLNKPVIFEPHRVMMSFRPKPKIAAQYRSRCLRCLQRPK